MVPWPLELAEIPIPSLSQRRLQRYRPIPVELWILRPFSPVNPFSKIRGRSPAGMPMPLSSTDNRTRSFSFQVKKYKTGWSVRYFTALLMSWSRIKRTHLSSVYTTSSISSTAIVTWFCRNRYLLSAMASCTTSLRQNNLFLHVRCGQSTEPVP